MAPPHAPAAAGQRGYALIALLVILGTGLLYYLVRQMEQPAVAARHGEASLKAMSLAKQALLGYAATYRDSHANEMFGHLPCPDTDGDGIAEGTCGAAGQSVVGYLPYKTLGLPDLRDESGACLWYAVAGNFKSNPKTAQPVNWDLQGNFLVRTAAGAVRLAPEDAEGGAAATIFAPGGPLAGQDRQPTPAGEPQKRCGGDPAANYTRYLESAAMGAGAAAGTVTLTEGDRTTGANNDAILAITPREVFTAIKTRGDFAAAINTLSGHVALNMQGSAVLPAPVAGVAAGPKLSGLLAATVPGSYAFPAGTGTPDYYPAWAGQYRYTVCANQKTRCLNGGACTGVLMFAGERAAGGPRTAAEAADHATFLEGGNLANFTGAGTTFAGAASFAVANPRLAAAQDVMLCLNPPEVSFQRDLGDFQDAALPLNITGVSGTQSLVNRTTGALVLGNDDATTGRTDADTGHVLTTGQLFGCTWYNADLPFGTGVRIYFKFRIENNTAGEGFTMVLADAVQNDTLSGQRCGAGGARLGYAGTNANALGLPYTPQIIRSKLGIEFDTGTSASRNDPNNRHVALLYWNYVGPDQVAAMDDDNVHWPAGTPPVTEAGVIPAFDGSLTSPLSTKRATLNCLNQASLCPTADQRTFLVRMDIVRSYVASVIRGTSTYDIKAWVTQGSDPGLLPGFDNVAIDFESMPGAAVFAPSANYAVYLAETVTLQDLSATGATFNLFRVGFTVGQSTVGQRFTVSDFKLRSR